MIARSAPVAKLVAEVADLLAEDYQGWLDTDFQELEGGKRVVTDEAWQRVSAEKERWLRGLLGEGKLPGRGKGRDLRIRLGSFDDLIGWQTDVVPEDYLSYPIVLDCHADEAGQERLDLRRLQGVLDGRPLYAAMDSAPPSMPTSHIEALREGTVGQAISCWVQLRCVETALDELSADSVASTPSGRRFARSWQRRNGTCSPYRSTFLG
jgi:hypothetical protein